MTLPEIDNDVLRIIVISILILIGGFIASIWLFRILKRILKKYKNPAIKRIASIIQYPFKVLVLLVALNFVRVHLQSSILIEGSNFGQLFYILFLTVITWLAISVVKAAKAVIIANYDVGIEDNLKARKIHTQIKVFERIAVVLIVFFTVALALLSFEAIRQVGVSLLASAGIAGIIIGFAAQKSISMLLAGFQLAITQPIRLDDVVIVEGEWGKVEEITLTFVVIAIWDKRRLVLPVTYFIDTPFQNWTRQTSEILGTVFIYVDYGFPVDRLREFMTQSLSDNPHWDGKVNVLQVTDCTEKSIELRALASARDSSTAWDLRVKLREELIEFIRLNYPEYLPQNRLKMEEPKS
jgi:small-conductance mechanosensitive channel